MLEPVKVEDVTWLAGLFEGEGYISLLPSQGIRVGINMTDKDVLEKAHWLFGGRFDKPTRREPYKTLYRWLITNWTDAIELLDVIRPYMGERRTSKIGEALAAYDANDGRYKGWYQPCTTNLGISNAGYMWHLRHNKLPACANCMTAYRRYMTQYRANKKASGGLDSQTILISD